MRPLFSPLLAALIVFPAFLSLHAQDEGVFARFSTSVGDIRVRLAANEAPTVTSNFVALAEGSQPALHLAQGRLLTTGFYDGTPIDRVESGAWIEAGSPAGAGGQPDPGYTLPIELHSELNFDAPYRLAMARDGSASHGSRFFFTALPLPGFNESHTIFGDVVEGHAVVDTLVSVEVDSEGRPLTPLTIDTITIEREGAEGLAFLPDLAALPQVAMMPLQWEVTAERAALRIPFRLGGDYRLFHSLDLLSWSERPIGFFDETVPEDATHSVSDLFSEGRQGFFKVAEIHYALDVLPPDSLEGKVLRTQITQFGNQSTRSMLEYSFTSPTGGLARLGSGKPVPFPNSNYHRTSRTRATLIVPSNLTIPFNLSQFVLAFTSEDSGNFTALLPAAFPAPTLIAGSFELDEGA
jgi:peptidyl-prolyl cis-trans isomerase A (cyclophilin A)